MTHTDAPAAFARDLPRMTLIYLSVGLIAGAVIALQIGIMRVFSVGSWAHFGSLVVSLAMLGFGLTSAVMCVSKGWFERHWEGVAAGALLAFGPVVVSGVDAATSVMNLSARGDLDEAAANLFGYLRALDVHGAHTIAVMPVPHHGLGEAINDRLRRAAARRD